MTKLDFEMAKQIRQPKRPEGALPRDFVKLRRDRTEDENRQELMTLLQESAQTYLEVASVIESNSMTQARKLIEEHHGHRMWQVLALLTVFEIQAGRGERIAASRAYFEQKKSAMCKISLPTGRFRGAAECAYGTGPNGCYRVVIRVNADTFVGDGYNLVDALREAQNALRESMPGVCLHVAGLSPQYSESGLSSNSGFGYLGEQPVNILDPCDE